MADLTWVSCLNEVHLARTGFVGSSTLLAVWGRSVWGPYGAGPFAVACYAEVVEIGATQWTALGGENFEVGAANCSVVVLAFQAWGFRLSLLRWTIIFHLLDLIHIMFLLIWAVLICVCSCVLVICYDLIFVDIILFFFFLSSIVSL